MRKTSTWIILALLLIVSLIVLILASVTRRPSPSVPPVAAVPRASCSPYAISSGNTCQRRVLVFIKTAAFHHASIKDAVVSLQKLGGEHNVAMDFTDDGAMFTDTNLPHYNAVVFLMTSGEVLDTDQQAAFERYIRAGGGYAGVHSASDTGYHWSWYGNLVGAYFRSHPSITQATINVVDRTHPSTSMLPTLWTRTDEWYNFRTNPRANVHVLMTLDETTYKGGTMGSDHPIAWYHIYDGGRSWYTALGHTSESYSDPLFLAHLWGGIAYAGNF